MQTPTSSRHSYGSRLRAGAWMLGWLLACTCASAQALPAPAALDALPGARTCLVLSGGGARGIAHIGVLRVLERERIPVHCIVGTSMGAVIGSLHASGLDADEVERAILAIDWVQVFSDAPARLDRPLRQRELDRSFLVDSAIGYRRGRFGIPLSLLQGQRLGLALRGVLLPVATVEDFDALPIPFRAVATDLENGEGVILGEGDLARAVRASMAVPGVFPPVEIDGRLLMDGGTASNLPVSVARGLGAQRIIAVDISAPLRSREELASPLSITDQMLTAMIRRQTEAEAALLGPGDVLLRPELGKLGSADFALAAREAIGPGESAATDALGALRGLAVDAESYAAYRATRRARIAAMAELPRPDIKGAPPAVRSLLEAWRREYPEAPDDLASLQAQIGRIYGSGRFESVDYRLRKREDGMALELDARERRFGDGGLAFGLRLRDDFDGNSDFELGARLRDTEVSRSGAEWLAELRVGRTTLAAFEWLQPLGPDRRHFLLPEARYSARTQRVEQGERQVLEFRRQSIGVGFDAGRWLGRWGQASLGLQRQQDRYDRISGPQDSFAVADESPGAFRIGLYADTQDDPQFPSRGTFHRLGLRRYSDLLGGSFDAYVLGYEGSYAWPTFGEDHLLLRARLQLTEGDRLPLDGLSYLGGFLNLSGLPDERLAGSELAFGQAIYYRSAGRLFDRYRLFYGGSLEAGNTWFDRSDISFDSLLIAGSAFIAADSPLGALYFGYGRAEGGVSSLYLFIGRPY
jgi:NTE family protein